MPFDVIAAVALTAILATAAFSLRDYLIRKKSGLSGSGDLLEISERVSFDAGQLIWLIDTNNRQISSLVNIINNIASSSEQNAANTHEVSAGIQQLSSLASEIFKRSDRIQQVFEIIMQDSLENRGWIEKSGKTLIDISGTIKTSADAMDQLNAVVGKVNNILESIKGVTEEVNLLALNASIEAARAGEAGRGFTVVANEVKNLSEKTDKMTREVQDTINEVNNQLQITAQAIGSGVGKISEVEEISRKSVQSFDGIVRQLEDVKSFIGELTENTRNQLQVTEQSTNAVYAISEESSDISSSIHDISGIFEEQSDSSTKILDYSRNLHKVGYDLHRFSAARKSSKVLIFGINPFTDPAKIKEQYLPVIKKAGKNAGLKTRIVIVSNYEALTDYIKNGLIDIGWFSPTAYVNAKNVTNLTPLVTPVKYGKPSYEGVIITHKESGFNRIADLKGCSFSFVDPLSTSGYLYPLQLLKDSGINPETDFKSTDFLGNHDNVIKAVLDRRIDAGATFTGALVMARKEGLYRDEIVVLGETESIPNDAIAAKATLSPLVINSLRKHFTELGRSQDLKEHFEKAGIDGFQEVRDKDYDVIRRQQER